ncbi:hypothetical protein SDC9_185748 [bioreactor metagenome]|uniref:Uncharacterized protein n=1 Tax=bioreactor metagenome TaxID=1076179 RepID=A0A645HQ19_9ZZZZ
MVLGGGQVLMSRRQAVLGLIDHRLLLLQPQADGEGLLLHMKACLVKHLLRVARAVAQGQNQPVGCPLQRLPLMAVHDAGQPV